MIAPHGGVLVNRLLNGEERKQAKVRLKDLPTVAVRPELLRDLQNLAFGVFSPLEGPLGRSDFESVLERGRLSNGLPWTVPLVVDVNEQVAHDLREGQTIALRSQDQGPAVLLHLQEKYRYDKTRYAQSVYGTTDSAHPGAAGLAQWGEVLLAGPIDLIEPISSPYDSYPSRPEQTRAIIAERGWKTVGAFQTRNIPHAGHETLQKTMLSLVDGLMVHPIIGKKKAGDFTDSVILKAYDTILREYFQPERVLLAILPTEMRYAGPKEAVFHAIMRQNFGCTHLVVGRDHAGVGKFYHPEAAIEIFEQYPDLALKPVTMRGDFFYCRRCGALGSERTCPHDSANHIPFSGTEIRRLLAEGGTPPPEILRPEVFEVLRQEAQPFVT